MNVILYTLKLHFKTLILYISLVYLPFFLTGIYLGDIPYIPYFFMLALFAYKIITENEKAYQKSISENVRLFLIKRLGKNPSQAEIFSFVLTQSRIRDFLFFFSVVIVVIGGILLNLF